MVKKCSNDSTRSYRGNEPSPKGNGVCAHAEREGLEMQGRDGRWWRVTKDRIGRKSWRPLPKGKAPETEGRDGRSRTGTKGRSRRKAGRSRRRRSSTKRPSSPRAQSRIIRRRLTRQDSGKNVFAQRGENFGGRIEWRAGKFPVKLEWGFRTVCFFSKEQGKRVCLREGREPPGLKVAGSDFSGYWRNGVHTRYDDEGRHAEHVVRFFTRNAEG